MRPPRALPSLALVLLPILPFIASCGDSTGPPPVGAIVPQGAALEGQVGSFITVRVRVDDQEGIPIEGIEVGFSPLSGAGSASPAAVETGVGGLAQTSWTLGTTTGTQSLRVSAGAQSLTLSASVEAGPPASLEIVSGDGQAGAAGQPLGSPVTVRVVDRFDNPAPGASVTFSSPTPGASFNPSAATSGSDGRASTVWTLGRTAGPQTMGAQASGAGSVAFSASAAAGPPAQVVVVSGDSQEAQVGETLPEALVARVQDEFGNQVEGASLQFEPAEGSGSVSPATTQSDDQGRASTTWTLGNGSGEQTVEARVSGAEGAVFSANATPGPATALVKVSGDGQMGVIGAALADPVVVEARDDFGNGVQGVSVSFNPANGTVTPGLGETDEKGRRSVTWTLGGEVGEQTLEATADGIGTVTFTATADPGQIQISRGDGQTTPTGTPVPIPPQVRVVDASENPVAGVTLTFQVASGGGSVEGGVRTTGADGLATVDEWILGAAAGENTLEVSGNGVAGVTFTATAEPVGEGYDIEVRFVGDPPDDQAKAFADAEARWEAIIVAELPDQAVNIAAGECGIPHPAVNETVDDVVIFSQLDSIDGPGNILGQAGPCLVRPDGRLPVIGVMQFDTADLANLQASGRLEEVILHEMGHVLGFVPNIWGDLNLNAGRGTADTRFLGPGAIARYEAAGGVPQGSVPLENGGGPGTQDAHWEEEIFDNELMTGFIDSGANPLSAITAAAFSDMGYIVDVSQTDDYTIPGSALRAEGRGYLIQLRELPPPEPRVVGPDGRPMAR